MAHNKVIICGVNTTKLPLLSDEEKEALFLRMSEGDNRAKDELIKGNLRLVLSIIQRFNISGNESVDDLFQV
jgi:RNA polymerase sporulation-specific sigma factor